MTIVVDEVTRVTTLHAGHKDRRPMSIIVETVRELGAMLGLEAVQEIVVWSVIE